MTQKHKTEKKDAYVIYNRYALKRKPRHTPDEVSAILTRNGLTHEIAYPEKRGDAATLAANAVANGFTRIISTGGDGTINEIVNGVAMIQSLRGAEAPRATIGILPNGRGNDFGFALGIPSNDLEKAAAIIAAGKKMTVDIGLIDDGYSQRYFVNGTGIGIDAAINNWATTSWLNGFPSYLWGLVKAVAINYVQPVMRIKLDEREIEKQVLLMAILNGRREGGGFDLAPDYDLQDGLFNVLIIGDGIRIPRLLPVLPSLFNGNILNEPKIERYKARKIEIEVLGDGLYGQADGEVLHPNIRHFRAEVSSQTVDFFVPNP